MFRLPFSLVVLVDSIINTANGDFLHSEAATSESAEHGSTTRSQRLLTASADMLSQAYAADPMSLDAQRKAVLRAASAHAGRGDNELHDLKIVRAIEAIADYPAPA